MSVAGKVQQKGNLRGIGKVEESEELVFEQVGLADAPGPSESRGRKLVESGPFRRGCHGSITYTRAT